MTAKLKLCAAVAGVLATFVFTACSGGSEDAFSGDEGLLRFVPADSPYVFASGEPVDDKFLDALEPHIDEVLDAYRDLLTTVSETEAEGDAEAEAVSALLTELSPLFSVDGLRKAGLERNAQMVLYGNGLLPVLRVEVSDPEAFEATIADLEDANGEPMAVASIGDREYRYFGDEDVRIVIGVFDGMAVLTAMPEDFDETQTRELLGLDLPARNITSTGILPAIVDKYGYSNHYVGYVDTMRFVDSFLAEPSTLNAALIDRMEFDAGEVSDVCKTEIRELAALAPRAVFGYKEISLDRISGSFVVELRKDIASGLQSISAPVPGLGQDQGGVLSFGASVNVQAFRDFYAARLDAMEADPFECEYFAELQAGVPEGRAMLQQPLPPVVYGIRGFNAVVDALDVTALSSGQPPDPGSVEASVVVAMEDAASLVAMGMMFSPELAALDLQPDGKAVPLALPQLDAMSISAYAAMVKDALSVAVGPAAESRVTGALAAASVLPPPMFAFTMDAGKYYELVSAGIMADTGDDEEPVSPEAKAAMQRVFSELAKVYDRMSTVVHFNEHGAVVDSVVELKDL